MPLEIQIPKVQAPSISSNAPSFSTPNLSMTTSGFPSQSPSTVNVSSLSTGGIKGSIAPPVSLSSIKPGLSLNGSANISGATLKTMAVGAGMTALAGAAKSMNIPLGLPSTTDALKTLGVPTDLKSLQALTGLQLPKFPLFEGMDLPAILLGKSPKFIADVVLKFKTISPPFIPGLKMNMGIILAAAAVIKAALSGDLGKLLKHLLDNILGEIKGELTKSLMASIESTGITKIGQQLNKAINDATRIQIQTSVKLKPKQYDEEGNEIPPEEEEFQETDEFSSVEDNTNYSTFGEPERDPTDPEAQDEYGGMSDPEQTQNQVSGGDSFSDYGENPPENTTNDTVNAEAEMANAQVTETGTSGGETSVGTTTKNEPSISMTESSQYDMFSGTTDMGASQQNQATPQPTPPAG